MTPVHALTSSLNVTDLGSQPHKEVCVPVHIMNTHSKTDV